MCIPIFVSVTTYLYNHMCKPAHVGCSDLLAGVELFHQLFVFRARAFREGVDDQVDRLFSWVHRTWFGV